MNSKLPPVTQVNQGDTCKGCSWLVRGAQQFEKGVFDWGCRFYHANIGYSKPYPLRLKCCDIDGRLSQAKYKRQQAERNAKTTDVSGIGDATQLPGSPSQVSPDGSEQQDPGT